MPLFILIIFLAIGYSLIVYVNHYRFTRMVDAEVQTLFKENTRRQKKVFSPSDVAHLPQPVQKYLRHSLREGQPYIENVHLKQNGLIRLGADQPWKAFEAEQYFTSEPPAFIWLSRMKLLPFVWVIARDKYMHQQGNMLIKLLSTLTIADARDDKIASGALLRYMAEMMWFPTALIASGCFRWEAIDNASAKLVGQSHGQAVTLTFCFDENWDIARVVSYDRFRDSSDIKPIHWYGVCKQYQEFDGVRIPSKVEVGWEDYTYWQGTVTEIVFNM